MDASDSDGTVLGPRVAGGRFLRKVRVEARAADVAVTPVAPPGTTAWGGWGRDGKAWGISESESCLNCAPVVTFPLSLSAYVCQHLISCVRMQQLEVCFF